MNRIVIVIEGGLVQSVMSDEKTEVLVLDLDTEGADAAELIRVSGQDMAATHSESVVHPSLVDEAFEAYGQCYDDDQDRESYAAEGRI